MLEKMAFMFSCKNICSKIGYHTKKEELITVAYRHMYYSLILITFPLAYFDYRMSVTSAGVMKIIVSKRVRKLM